MKARKKGIKRILNYKNKRMEEKEMKEAEISTEKDLVTRFDKRDFLFIIVLLVGLLVGSLFIDVAQLISGQGFSQNAIRKADVLESNGKTWVAYNDPVIPIQVLTDDTCEKCNTDEALIVLRQYIPTLIAEKVEISTEKGKKLATKINAKTVPAFVFDSSLEKIEFYTQAQQVLEKKDDVFILNTLAMGMPVGKYISLPEIGEDAIRLGTEDAKLRVIEYSDFQCPYCKTMQPAIEKMLREYGDRIEFVYKHLPLSFHLQAENAALASECANEQGKFKEYHDKLFIEQEKWGKTQGTASFKQYALQLGLSGQRFNTCLDSKKYADKVSADAEQAQEFGIMGTPGIFIGEEFLGGAVQYETLKEMIDSQLEESSSDTPSAEGQKNKI